VKNIELCARMIATVSDRPKIVVEKSTVPVKTAETLKRVLAANGGKGVEHSILSNPEVQRVGRGEERGGGGGGCLRFNA
jgi:UDPglucose 6-dehydrogenase